jgi:hypothetical protein
MWISPLSSLQKLKSFSLTQMQSDNVRALSAIQAIQIQVLSGQAVLVEESESLEGMMKFLRKTMVLVSRA